MRTPHRPTSARFSALTVVLVAAVTASVVAAASSWAAAKITAKGIAKNAVTTTHIRNSTIRSADIRNGTITQADINPKARAALRGQRGEQGSAGPQGPTGVQGPAGPLLDTLPSGRTLTGMYAVQAPNRTRAAISFPIPLAQAPDGWTLIKWNDPPTINCPGTAAEPAARPGRLCLYGSPGSIHGMFQVCPVTMVCGSGNPLSRFGAILDIEKLNDLNPTVLASGSWAVTAH